MFHYYTKYSKFKGIYEQPPFPSGFVKRGQQVELYSPIEQILEQQSSFFLQFGW